MKYEFFLIQLLTQAVAINSALIDNFDNISNEAGGGMMGPSPAPEV